MRENVLHFTRHTFPNAQEILITIDRPESGFEHRIVAKAHLGHGRYEVVGAIDYTVKEGVLISKDDSKLPLGSNELSRMLRLAAIRSSAEITKLEHTFESTNRAEFMLCLAKGHCKDPAKELKKFETEKSYESELHQMIATNVLELQGVASIKKMRRFIEEAALSGSEAGRTAVRTGFDRLSRVEIRMPADGKMEVKVFFARGGHNIPPEIFITENYGKPERTVELKPDGRRIFHREMPRLGVSSD